MATTYDKASLVMIPSGYKDDKLYSIKPTDGSGDFTFSRDGAGASPATRLNASGLIEKGRENILLQSNTFDTTWSTTRASFIGGQSGYDGTNDAWAMVDDANNSTHLSAQSLTIGASVATFSIYAKAGDVDFLAVRFEGSSVDYAYFNLGSGTLGTIDSDYIEARITSVGGGWYRCEATRVLAASGNQVVILSAQANNDPTYAGAGTTAIYIQDAQVELGLVATDVIETTTTAVSAGLLGDMPRLDYSGGATCPSLLLEPSRVNLFTQSEYFSSWSTAGTTPVFTNNYGISPEGLQNSTRVQLDNGDIFYQGVNLSQGAYVFSVFGKAISGGSSQIILRVDIPASIRAVFDLSNGTIVTNTSDDADIIDYGNGWYRCILIQNNDTILNAVIEEYDDSLDCEIYGAQLESGSYPTSYIPTYGSASTRGQDLALKGSVSSLINDAEGTIFIEASTFENGADCRVGLSDNTINNRVSIEWDANADTLKGFIGIGGNLETTSYDQTNRNKIAITYDSTDARMYVNGTKVDTDTSVPTLSGMDRIDFSNYGAGIPFEGNAHQMLVFKTKLTDAEAIALTTI